MAGSSVAQLRPKKNETNQANHLIPRTTESVSSIGCVPTLRVFTLNNQDRPECHLALRKGNDSRPWVVERHLATRHVNDDDDDAYLSCVQDERSFQSVSVR